MKQREVSTYGIIKNGQPHVTKRGEFMTAVCANFREGERFQWAAKKLFKQRSNPQNKYYWGVIIDLYIMGEEEVNGRPMSVEIVNRKTGEILYIPLSLKEKQEKAHEFLKTMFNRNEYDDEIRSTKHNSTTQQEEYHQLCREYIKFAYNISAPLPNEPLELMMK